MGLALLCTSGWTFPSPSPAPTLRFEQLSVEQGLAQETVTAIVQDHQGFMWFGSQGGLSRFDGYRVVVYKHIPDDPHSLADNWVQALYVDKENRLWVGTRGGLQLYDPVSDGFTHFLPDEPARPGGGQRYVHAIISDGHGRLWLATSDGLQHFDPASGRFASMRHDAADSGSLTDDRVTALALDAQENLWVGMKTGVDRLAAGAAHFQHFRIDDANAPTPFFSEVQSLWIDREQSLWISTMAGLETWRLGSGSLQRHRFGPADGLGSGMLTALYQDNDANVWVGTNADGLHRWDAATGRFVRYPTDPRNPAANEVSALYQDRTGSLWVGTWTAGVKHVDLASGGFNRFFHIPGDARSLTDNRIFSIVDDGQGRLWLGGFWYLERMNLSSGEVTSFRHDPKNPRSLVDHEIILSVFRDKHGQLWAGTSAGLGRFDPATGRFTARLFQTGDPNSNSITSITGNRAGALWVASRGGLHRLDAGAGAAQTFRHDPADPGSLANDWVKMALEDRQGTLWVATDDGLDRLNRLTGRFSHFRHVPNDPASLSNDRVQYLFEDKAGVLWIGTNGGLNRMETGADGAIRFRAYTTKEGLGADSIGGILEDDTGCLWISTAAGISRFDATAGKFRNYTARDGMIEGYYYAGSAFRDLDGAMYFGGVNGLTAFRPEAIRDNPFPPRAVITEIQVAGQTVHGGDNHDGISLTGAMQDAQTLTLPYRQAVFSLEFSALHYADPRRNRFAYQLQGFDKSWVSADAGKRVATYTNLDPGQYVFRIKAANKDGVWDETGATLAITITPPFWKTWWFRALTAALLLGGIWAAYRARIRLLTEQKNMLEDEVQARTHQLQDAQEQLQRYLEDRERLFISISHDLRTPITRLKLRTELLDDDAVRDEFHDDLDDLDMMVKGALQCVKDSDIHENPTEIRLDLLINRLIRGAQLAGHEVTYAASGLSVRAKPLALKRAIGNLLDNALHYGERVEISISADTNNIDAKYIDIQIRDHGPGVPEEALANLREPYVRLEHGRGKNEGGLGLGLSIARGIAEAHGGELLLRNHPEGGLCAIIRIPSVVLHS